MNRLFGKLTNKGWKTEKERLPDFLIHSCSVQFVKFPRTNQNLSLISFLLYKNDPF